MRSAGSTAWQAQAACATAPAEVREVFMADAPDSVDIREAVTVCKACPVLAECLSFALAVEGGYSMRDRFGIWGGTTPRQRYAIHLTQPDDLTGIPA